MIESLITEVLTATDTPEDMKTSMTEVVTKAVAYYQYARSWYLGYS